MRGMLPVMETIISISRYKRDSGKLRRNESEIISKASQIIEPVINTVVSGTIARPEIIPAGAIIPKVKLQTPAVARNAPQEIANGCKIKFGILPASSDERAKPVINIPSIAK